jgi:lysophospholipid acyltransferase (LPLAT)-like uncharacterized protein
LRPLRSPWVMGVTTSLLAAYLRLTYATLRWTREGQTVAEQAWAESLKDGGGAILCFWHSRVPVAPTSWPQGPDKPRIHALISQSTDGEFIARVMDKIGFPAVRGSSAKKTDLAKNKGGEQAFRDMVKWVRDGNAMAVTPDGPRGPAEHLEKGVVTLARMTGAPVLFVGIATQPCIRLNSWDRTIVPLPFARAAMVWDAPGRVLRTDDVDALAPQWADRLSAVSRRAEAIVGETVPKD